MKLPCTLKLRHTGSSNHGRGGEGAMITENLSCTLAAAVQDQTLFTGGRGGAAYGINPVMSGVMMETKPAEETAQTLRKSPGGDNGVVQTIGFKASQSADGGLGDEREVSLTLSHKPSALEPTVAQSNIAQMRYIVRRLTPTEAERLMGLPDGYLIPTGLRRFFNADGEPPPELVSEFVDIFDKFNAIMAEYEHKKPPKGKSYNQVAAWLKKISDPATCPDSPMYKAAGNGWATNQPRWILTRLLAIGEGIDPFEESNTSSGGCREAGASATTHSDNVPTVGAPANFCEGGAA